MIEHDYLNDPDYSDGKKFAMLVLEFAIGATFQKQPFKMAILQKLPFGLMAWFSVTIIWAAMELA